MLIDENGLRELYAQGEIDLAQLERSLDIINRRREAAEQRGPSPRASVPMPPEEREKMLDRAADAQLESARARRQRPIGEQCPRCHQHAMREVVEHGVRRHWCRGCQSYIGPDPRELLDRPWPPEDGGFVVGVIFPLG